MAFGDPIIYNCPSCRKMMKMLTPRSYTSRGGGSLYSDSFSTGGSRFTSDLAKCDCPQKKESVPSRPSHLAR